MRCISARVSSILFLYNNEELPRAALKIRKINWLLQIFGTLLGCRSHDKLCYLNLFRKNSKIKSGEQVPPEMKAGEPRPMRLPRSRNL